MPLFHGIKLALPKVASTSPTNFASSSTHLDGRSPAAVYFNNDAEAYAVRDERELRRLIENHL